MKWVVKNFKGIAECSLLLDAGITTILTGVNSSGKTSLIQSLLLIRQTRPTDRGLVLNGPLVRLGNAQDLVRDTDRIDKISLALEDEQSTYELDLIPAKNKRADPGVEEDPLGTSLDIARLSIISDPHVKLAELVAGGIRASDIELIRQKMGFVNERSILRIKPQSLAVPRGALPRTYVIFNGIRPVSLVRCYDKAKLKSDYKNRLLDIVEQYRMASDGSFDLRRGGGLFRALRQYVAREIGPFLAKAEGGLDFGDARPGLSQSAATRASPRGFRIEEEALQRLISMGDEKVDALVDQLAEKRSEDPTVVVELRNTLTRDMGPMELDLADRSNNLSVVLTQYAESIRRLSVRLNYLGPLRDEPRVVWGQWNSETPGLPVGIKGELTASYLAKNEDRPVRFCNPLDYKETTSTLRDAAALWLEYLGIGTEVHARSYGKIGVGLEISWENKVRDLTSVGVGVSQALPIVLAGLAVSQGSILIIEQPELHLHPDVQAKLADFFLFAKPDVSFVVETHSEALITRVRRRVAESVCDPGALQLIFVEPEWSQSSKGDKVRSSRSGSVGRRISMTSTGDFEEWPEGFISGSLQDTQAIFEANIGRVRKAMQDG